MQEDMDSCLLICRFPIFGDQLSAHSVIGSCPVDICLHQRLAGDLSFLDSVVHTGNRCLLEVELALRKSWFKNEDRQGRRQNRARTRHLPILPSVFVITGSAQRIRVGRIAPSLAIGRKN